MKTQHTIKSTNQLNTINTKENTMNTLNKLNHKLKACTLAVGISLLGSNAIAKEYMELDLGVAKKEDVTKLFKSKNASFNSNYGYKGYANDLPIFKIDSFSAFDKHGTVKEAWAYFTPKNVLYKFDVTYADTGSTFKVFADALSSKYQLLDSQTRGFTSTYSFVDEESTLIILTRNTFGFGSDQTTKLEYWNTTFNTEVDEMKERIEKHIAEQNAKKAGNL